MTAVEGKIIRASVDDRMWSPDGARAANLDPRNTQGVTNAFAEGLQRLSPKADSQSMLKSQVMQVSQNLGQTRLLMLEQADSSISWPFLAY
jgi:hypothetical protein